MNRHSPAAKNLGYQRNIDHIFLWLNILCLPVFSFLSTSQYLFAQKNEIRFERITVDQGLSQNSVICIFQDRKDFMWFGTLDGLNKFDGYEFTHYRKELFEVNTLFYNYITAIYEDKNGRIWIGTDAELLKFDKRSGELKPSGLWYISSICEDDSGKLWVGTAGSGLHKYDREKDEFVNFKHDSTNLNSLSNNVVLNIHKDATGIFWIGTYGGGLDKIDPENEKFTHYKHDPTNPNSLNNNKITALCESNIAQNRKLWIGTEGGGLNCFDLIKNEYTHYIHTPSDPNSLSDNIIQTLLFDEKTATLWIGTKNG